VPDGKHLSFLQTNEKLASVFNLGLKFGSDIDLVFRRRLFPIVESL